MIVMQRRRATSSNASFQRRAAHQAALATVLVSVLLACGASPSVVNSPAAVATQSRPQVAPSSQLLVTGLQGAQGSAVGPGGALYVTEPAAGRIVRIDPQTGEVTPFVSGLPTPLFDVGGVMDLVFIGRTAYALVSLVGTDVGGHNAVGIYRVDGPDRITLVGDIGAYALAHPPMTSYFVPTGVQYALEAFRGGFLVTDGHHNRVLQVTRDGVVSELIAFGNLVPTGLAIAGDTVYMAEAGPVPHLPETGRVVAFRPGAPTATTVASGARLLVDVKFGRGQTLFALAQGVWGGPAEGDPALPGTGSLVRVNADGTLTELVSGLNRPTSMEIIGDTAYIITLDGEVWTVGTLASAPFGHR
ncbi:ScyD/ScyE family protein [Deinococcus navajonensis]|uniref:ScyD/ScyE family protein n=1 Tax=Deinococcus navajonensis TaxID=309884 RepID=A0ABV8XJ29_9DEIO